MSNYDVANLQTLPPVEFEALIKSLLLRMGFNASMTKASGDGGIDVIAINEQPIISGKYVVQCKRYSNSNNIGEPIIRELYGVMHSEHANKGILVTTSDFTKQAVAFAKDKAIELINGPLLVMLLNRHLSGISNDASGFVKKEEENKFGESFDNFIDSCNLLLKREAYGAIIANRSTLLIPSEEDNYAQYAEYHAAYNDIEEYIKEFQGLCYWCPEEVQNGQVSYLLRWHSYTEREDIKIIMTFIDDYVKKILLLYKALNRDPAQNASWLSRLEVMFKLLKAAKESTASENPKFAEFISEQITKLIV